MRPKDSLLQALSLFRGLNPTITVNEIISFLYTCENEGLSVQELAFVSQMTEPTASRSIRSFGREGAEWARAPACGLVEAFMNPRDARSRVLHLTPAGVAMRERLDEIIRQGVRIAPEAG
ncbi:MarR family winged helix-turn-helix transcriptional regulator [Phenylobacterium sp.]|mgnify:CR=1 FL=1|uniref:MarR family winged helix-turn-helix transcriptional regulator n=1 Tax=Phenylobacterium sp. TaxID=1871053 RepID=UPI0027311DE0|nr:MarR family winged helix-turn-helix transcriptional regulator [Phenylobacterium sp.]MDP1599254.1 MarR family winged helix-turn-helix transcriptional regulator [Phenylobacterium sp.]MDP3592431.1 MarR family winged helix-turn-helix transcriptional regulator [Phenylobacterium sp.]